MKKKEVVEPIQKVEQPIRKVSKYKPPPKVEPTERLYIVSFNNGEQHRTRLELTSRPRHFIAQVMREGSTSGSVYYPPFQIKKIQWEDV